MDKKFFVIILIALAASACSASAGEGIEFAPTVGANGPLFELESVEGERVSLEAERGKVVLLNFWATWCGPCRLEMPAIQDRFENTELDVLAINFDETEGQIQSFVDELGLTFRVLKDPGGDIQQLYQVRGYPTTFILDEEGVVRVQHIGFLDESQLDGYLKDLGLIN